MNHGPADTPVPLDPAPAGCAWKSAVEIFPADWKTPAAQFWIAGWILSANGGAATDVRAWFGEKLFLGLHGLPRGDIEVRQLGRAGPPYAGFSFLLQPDATARELRLEVCDANVRWQEFFRQTVAATNDGDTPRSDTASPTESDLSRALLHLLMARRTRPQTPWSELTDEALSAATAFPLNALPNPPLYGRLELPRPVADVKFGLLEISGWLAHRTERIRNLTAFVGACPPVALLHGRARTDVSDVFGELRDGPNSAFVGFIQIPPRAPHPLSLSIIAEMENGERHLAFNQRFHPRVTVESAFALPVFSEWLFVEALAAFAAAMERRRLPLEAIGAAGEIALDVFRAEAPAGVSPSTAPLSAAAPSARRPLSVVLVTHNLNREGAPLIALEYARHLGRLPGWSVRVVSPETGPLAAEFSAAGLPVEILPAEAIWSAPSEGEFDAAVQSLASHACWRGADLIVANTMVSFWAIHVARQLGKPSLLYVHESSSVRKFFAALAGPALLPKIEQAFGAANRVAFSAAVSQIAHLSHQRAGNFCVAPGWIDVAGIESYCAAHEPKGVRQAGNLPEDAVVFANIGSVTERKGQHVFVEAIDLFLRGRTKSAKPTPRLIFLMVGASPGPYVDFLRAEIARRGLADVELIAKASEPFAYFRAADVFVCTSFEESLPRVVMEAAAFALPVVSTSVNGIPEILSNDAAWLVPPGNAPALASAMDSALEAHLAGDRSRSERGRRSVREKFAADILLPRHAALASAVADERNR